MRVDRRRREADVHEPGEVEAADEAGDAADVGREREREPDEDPDDADEGEPEEAVHDRREDVLAPDEAAVEQGEAGQHDHDQRGGDQQPGGVAAVDRQGSASAARARLGTATASIRPARSSSDRSTSHLVLHSAAGLARVCEWRRDGSRPRAATEAMRLGGGTGAKRGRSAEEVDVDVGHRLVADRLVDVVRGRVREVREQEAERAGPRRAAPAMRRRRASWRSRGGDPPAACRPARSASRSASARRRRPTRPGVRRPPRGSSA